MKERFEFTDGTYYEFERWEEDSLQNLKELNRYARYYVQVTDENSLTTRHNGDIRVLIKSSEADSFITKYRDAIARNDHAGVKPRLKGEVNPDVLGVGLSVDGAISSELRDFSHGIYIPIKFDKRVSGALFVDLNTITSKVVYEPSLITKHTDKELNTAYDRNF